jgi:hypothetical protein
MRGKRLDMQRQQIEIDFTEPRILGPQRRRQPRLTPARWWFAQMRRVVDQAWDWNVGPPARPEQTYLELARSHGKV